MDLIQPSKVHRSLGSPRDGGFTLMELLAVVVIIALLFSVVTVSWSALAQSQKLETSARQIASLISTVVSEAIRSGKKLEIVYDTEKQEVFYQPLSTEEGRGEENPEEGSLEGSKSLDSEENPQGLTLHEGLRKRRLPEGITFKDIQVGSTTFEEPGQIKIPVSGLGITSDHIVHLVDEGGREFSIEYHSITTTVSFHDGYKEYEMEEAASVSTERGE